jgi:hypothetical protein
MYRVEFSISALTDLANLEVNQETPSPSQFSMQPDTLAAGRPMSIKQDNHAVWIPAPIVECALPPLVATYYNRSRLGDHTTVTADAYLEPVCSYFILMVTNHHSDDPLDFVSASVLPITTLRSARQFVFVRFIQVVLHNLQFTLWPSINARFFFS